MTKHGNISIWYSVPLLSVLIFHMVCESMVIPVLAPTLATPISANHDMLLGWSPEIHKFCYGISLAVYPIAVFFCAPILGALSDRIGRKFVIMWSLVVAIAGSLLQGVGMEILSVVTFVIGRALVGATAGIDGTIQAALLDKCSNKKQKNFYLGASLFSMSLGFIIGPAFAAIFIDENSSLLAWSMPFFMTAAVFTAIMFALKSSMREKVEKAKTKIAQFDWFSGLRDIAELRHSKTTRILLLIFTFNELSGGCFTALAPLILTQDFGFGVKSLAWFMSLEGICGGILFALVGPKLLEKFTHRSVLVFSMFMSIISLILPFFPSIGAGIWIITATQALGFLLTYYVILAMFSELSAENKRGWILSVLSSLWGLTMGAGLVICGVLVTISNSVCLSACIVLSMIAMCACFIKSHKKSDKKSDKKPTPIVNDKNDAQNTPATVNQKIS